MLNYGKYSCNFGRALIQIKPKKNYKWNPEAWLKYHYISSQALTKQSVLVDSFKISRALCAHSCNVTLGADSTLPSRNTPKVKAVCKISAQYWQEILAWGVKGWKVLILSQLPTLSLLFRFYITCIVVWSSSFKSQFQYMLENLKK